ncbi:MAG: TetR/AcrR family transcriptional regulator [Chloroflexales bacterium]|nr:TetR/AcrR family transcriptional regulator [Chloroflexales bacterium]
MAKSDNDEREQRILDAAADLFVHYGYDKTTVDDIAREAGVSKGAIYLHFKSKDDLFEGLLIRELMAYQTKWLELIEADPKGGTIGGMYRNMLFALSSSPFMSVMFKQDGRVLGGYLRKPDNFFRRQKQTTRYEFVKMMQDAGAMRQDIDPKIVAHIMNMLAYGLVAMEEIMAKEDIPPTNDIIEGIAKMMDLALTPEDGGDNEAGKAILRQISEAGRRQFKHKSNPNQE